MNGLSNELGTFMMWIVNGKFARHIMNMDRRLPKHLHDVDNKGRCCSETMLSGESQFHISPPRGFEPVSLVEGSKQVVHWTSETC
jgi:hypothetical protein